MGSVVLGPTGGLGCHLHSPCGCQSHPFVLMPTHVLHCTVPVLALAIHVEDVVSAPRLRLDIVLHAAQAPLLGVGERVPWNAAQELHFLAVGGFCAILKVDNKVTRT